MWLFPGTLFLLLRIAIKQFFNLMIKLLFFLFLWQPWYYLLQFWHFWFILRWKGISIGFWSFGRNTWRRRRAKPKKAPWKTGSLLRCPAQVVKSLLLTPPSPQNFPGLLLLLPHHHRRKKPNRRYHWERTLWFSLHMSWRKRTDKDHRQQLRSQAWNSNWDRKTTVQPFWKRTKGTTLRKRAWQASKTAPKSLGFWDNNQRLTGVKD